MSNIETPDLSTTNDVTKTLARNLAIAYIKTTTGVSWATAEDGVIRAKSRGIDPGIFWQLTAKELLAEIAREQAKEVQSDG